MAALTLYRIVLVTAFVHVVKSQCPGITEDLVNSAATVGGSASMSFKACKPAPPTVQAIGIEHVHQITGDRRIWSSDEPDTIQVTNEGYDVEYPADFTSEGEYTLTISSVKLDHGGKYNGDFLLGTNRPMTSAVFVAVNSLTNSCPSAEKSKVSGQSIDLTCEVEYRADGVYQPVLTWKDLNSNDVLLYQSNRTHAAKLRSVANVTASWENNGQEFMCEFRMSLASEVIDSCSVSYDVTYSPRLMSVEPDPNQFENEVVQVSVGQEVSCMADSNPASKFYWVCNGQYMEGSTFKVSADQGSSFTCICEAQYKHEGVSKTMELPVQFMLVGGGTTVAVTGASGTPGWAIAVIVIVLVIVIGVIVGIVIYFKKMRNKSPKSASAENGAPAGEKPTYDNKNFQGSNANLPPKTVPPVSMAPNYANVPRPVKPGQASPGYADLGVKHLQTSLAGSTSSLDSDRGFVSANPVGNQPPPAQRQGGDTPV